MKRICFDLDGTLCSQVDKDYALATPFLDAIAIVNKLYEKGYYIVIHTARFMGRAGNNPIEAYKQGYAFTIEQLRLWGVQYHELHLGKPRYDLVIDDRSLFFKKPWTEHLESFLENSVVKAEKEEVN